MIASEEDAQAWLSGDQSLVSRETLNRFELFVALLRQTNVEQNLVASSTLDHVWQRHIADSVQLVRYAPAATAAWLDIGTGAGFPGLMVAAVHNGPVTLVEPRKLRADFLARAAEVLGIGPTIVASKVQHLAGATFDVISARAVAPLADLLVLAAPLSTEKTRFIFPKGRNAQSELDAAQRAWQGVFRSEPSLTDPEARIVIVEGLRKRRPGRAT